jgi:thiosulfate reductase/polysulfide reductase chain A
VDPRFDTRADWEIISGIAKRIGLSQLVFDSVEDVWRFQLEGTGMAIEDFADSGIVQTTDVPRYKKPEEFTFKTPGGKIEIVSKNLESWGIESLQPYQSPQKPDEGEFRLTFGRCALHTQGHTANNPLLFEQMAENVLWINTTAAEKLGISDNEIVTVSQNGYSETIKAKVTDMIHPEAVFVIHGFGHRIPVESRAYMKGLADNKFMKNGIDIYDPVGGAVAFQEHFVRVSRQ